MKITEVFRDNFEQEERRLLSALSRFNTVAFDTAYPGAISQTPQFAADEHRYRDLKSNVERTKLIQVGFAVFDLEISKLGGVWQFNFSGFSPEFHDHSPASIALLKNSGIDFDKNLSRGVQMAQFTCLLRRIRDEFSGRIQWVTFHGLYDAAYLLAALSGIWKLPSDIIGFTESAAELFHGGIYDLKLMAGDSSYMGLEKLASVMGEVRDEGNKHQAGSDSLLTAKVFSRAVYNSFGFRMYRGLLFGISVPIPGKRHCSAMVYCYPNYPAAAGYYYSNDVLV